LIAFGVIVHTVATRWDELNGVIKVALIVISPVGVAIGLLIRNFDKVKEVVMDVKDAFIGAWRAISGTVLGIINGLISAIARLIGWIQNAIDLLGQLGSNVPAAPSGFGPGHPPPSVTGHAKGGIFTSPTLGIIGEAGPEAVIPLNQAGMLGGLTVIINGDVTGEEIVRKVRDGLLKLKARNATTGL